MVTEDLQKLSAEVRLKLPTIDGEGEELGEVSEPMNLDGVEVRGVNGSGWRGGGGRFREHAGGFCEQKHLCVGRVIVGS